jgi:hypothetical protein
VVRELQGVTALKKYRALRARYSAADGEAADALRAVAGGVESSEA